MIFAGPPRTAQALTYVQPTTVEAIRSVGVRIAGAEELAGIISKAKQEMKTGDEEHWAN